MIPTTKAAVAVIITPAAATSLAFAIKGSLSKVTLSHKTSIPVFNASAVITVPIAKTIRHHSVIDTDKRKPKIMARMAAQTWIRKLCSYLAKILKPLPEYLKELILFLQENFSLSTRFNIGCSFLLFSLY